MDPGVAKMPHEPDLALLADGKPDACSTAALPGLQILARWAVCIGAAATVGAALELAEISSSPRRCGASGSCTADRPRSSHRSVLRPG